MRAWRLSAAASQGFLPNHGAVAARVFGVVKGLVSPLKHRSGREWPGNLPRSLPRSLPSRTTDRDGQGLPTEHIERHLAQALVQAFGNQGGVFGSRVAHNHGKFLASKAVGGVGLTQGAAQGLPQFYQYCVARRVAECVIDALKVVNINHQQQVARTQLGQVLVKLSAVEDSAEAVYAGLSGGILEGLEQKKPVLKQFGNDIEPADIQQQERRIRHPEDAEAVGEQQGGQPIDGKKGHHQR